MKTLACFLLLTTALCAKPRTYSVAVLNDTDGHANAHTGPGFTYMIKRRVPGGEHFLVSGWPTPADMKAIATPKMQEKLKKGGADGSRVEAWRYVSFMETHPAKNKPDLDWAYFQNAKMRIIRNDGVTWANVLQNVQEVPIHEKPDSKARKVGKLNALECCILLDQPGYAKLKEPKTDSMMHKLSWARVISRGGLVGWVPSKALKARDQSEWVPKDPLPSVEP